MTPLHPGANKCSKGSEGYVKYVISSWELANNYGAKLVLKTFFFFLVNNRNYPGNYRSSKRHGFFIFYAQFAIFHSWLSVNLWSTCKTNINFMNNWYGQCLSEVLCLAVSQFLVSLPDYVGYWNTSEMSYSYWYSYTLCKYKLDKKMFIFFTHTTSTDFKKNQPSCYSLFIIGWTMTFIFFDAKEGHFSS